jgi:beta-galactosidase
LVKVYSNCATVELFLDGVSLGTRRRNTQDFPAAGLRWLVRLKEGENHLRAVGSKDGAEVSDELRQLYQTRKWEKPARLSLESVGGSDETLKVKVRALDRNGVECLDARNVVRFGMTGDARLFDNLGTSTGARKVELSNGHARIGVKPTGNEAVVSVSSEGLPTAFLNLSNLKRGMKD